VKDRGLAAYIAELVGTLFLTFFITSVVVLYVASGATAQFGSDFAVVGLVHAFVLTVLIIGIGSVSGGHFNPVITLAAAAMRRIDPIDALVYILAQLSGGVLGALLTKGLLLDEGRASDYGSAQISDLLGGPLQGAIVEGLGAFILVLTVCAVAMNANVKKEWAPLAIGTSLGFLVMVLGPLTGGSFNTARWFGPALVGNHFDDAWAYIVGPIVGALLAAGFFRFIIEGGAPEETTSVSPGVTAGPGARLQRDDAARTGATPASAPKPPAPPKPPPPAPPKPPAPPSPPAAGGPPAGGPPSEGGDAPGGGSTPPGPSGPPNPPGPPSGGITGS
jgi:MIP family channel proteins